MSWVKKHWRNVASWAVGTAAGGLVGGGAAWVYQKLLEQQAKPGGVRDQSARYGTPLSLVYGTARVPGSLVWMKSGGGTASQIVALAEGPIAGVARVWKADGLVSNDAVEVTPPDGGLGGAYVIVGQLNQVPLGHQTSWNPTEALGYPLVAYAWWLDRDLAPAAGWTWEVRGFLVGTGGTRDAHGIDVLRDVLTHPTHGAGLTMDVVTDIGADGTADSSARRYVTAEGFWISPAWTDQRPAAELAREVLDCIHCEALCSEGKAKIVPLGDVPVTGNGVTYTPANAVQYALGPDDFVTEPGEDPLQVEIEASSEICNVHPVEFLERAPPASSTDPAHAYNQAVVEATDAVHAAQFGTRKASVAVLHAVKDRAVAQKIAALRVRRDVHVRARYSFRLGWRFCRLEPGDIVTLTEPLYGLVARPVLLTDVKPKWMRDASGASGLVFEWEAEDWLEGTGSTVLHPTQSSESSLLLSSAERLLITPASESAVITAQQTADAAQADAASAATAAASASTLANEALSGLAGRALNDLSNVADGIADARLLASGYGLNECPNGDFSVWDAANGRPIGWEAAADRVPASAAGVNFGGDWSLLGNVDPLNDRYLNTPYLRQDGRIGDPSAYREWMSPPIPVVPGQRYCASALTGAHRCATVVFIGWLDAAGAWLGATSLTGAAQNDEEATGGRTLAGYKRCYSYGDAPAGAASARVQVRKHDTKAGYSDSYAFWARAAFERLPPAATEPGPWTPPARNIVSAGQMRARSATFGTLGVGSVGADELIAHNVFAHHMTIANWDNLIPNSNSDGGAYGPEGARVYEIGTGAYNGTWVRRLLSTPAGYDAVYVAGAASGGTSIPCAAGDRFYFEAQARMWSADGVCRVGIRFDSAAGDGIAWVVSSDHGVNAWVRVSVQGTAPAGAVRVNFYLEKPTGTEAWIDAMYARRMVNGSLIVDGEITAAKLSVGAVTAASCAADVFQTSNYQGSGSGDAEYAVRGAKMRQNASGQVPSLLVDAAGLRIGPHAFNALWFSKTLPVVGRIAHYRTSGGVLTTTVTGQGFPAYAEISGGTTPPAYVASVYDQMTGTNVNMLRVHFALTGSENLVMMPAVQIGGWSSSRALNSGLPQAWPTPLVWGITPYLMPVYPYIDFRFYDYNGNWLDPAAYAFDMYIHLFTYQGGGGPWVPVT